MAEKFTCPRRLAEGHASDDSPLVHDGPNRDEWRRDGTCSYDGSVSGDEFMQYVRDGKSVGVTDKAYKFYLNDGGSGVGKFYTHHLTEEQGWEFDHLWRAGAVNFDYRPPRLFIPGPSTADQEG